MPPRRTHLKSRNGCVPCRQRRVKCGEDGLPCGNCVRRELPCSYPEFPIPRNGSVHTPGTSSQVATPQSSTQEIPRSIENVERLGDAGQASGALTRLQELELMHHYVTETSGTMGTGQAIDAWRYAIPKEAAQYEFLMDGILGLSAMHMAHLRPAQHDTYAAAAMHYQNRGIRHYQPALSHITDENCRAMFAFGMIVTTITLAVANTSPDGPANSAQNTVITMFELVRGNTFVVVAKAYQSLRSSALNPIFTTFHEPVETPATEDVRRALSLLRQRLDASAADSEPGRHRMLDTAIEHLETGFRKVQQSASIGFVLGWPVVIDHAMFALLAQSDPMVQLIFLQYGVLLLHVHDMWYGKNFGHRLIRQMSDCLHALGPEWVPWTAWARDKAARHSSSSPIT